MINKIITYILGKLENFYMYKEIETIEFFIFDIQSEIYELENTIKNHGNSFVDDVKNKLLQNNLFMLKQHKKYFEEKKQKLENNIK